MNQVKSMAPCWTPTEFVFLKQGQVREQELFLQAKQALGLIAQAQANGEHVLGLETFELREDVICVKALYPCTDEVEDVVSFLEKWLDSDYWFVVVLDAPASLKAH